MCGTNPAFQILKTWIEERKLEGEDASGVLATLPAHLQTPGPDIVRQFYVSMSAAKRLRWSRGSVLAFGTPSSRVRTPGRSRWIFRAKKIRSTPSFGREVKQSVPCRSFTACKRSLNVTCKSAFRQNYRTFRAHSSTFRRWVLSRGDTRGDAWW